MTLLECERTLRRTTAMPSSISWRSVGEMVHISVEVINDSSEQTVPDTLVIEAAAFGAFVPTVPIARIGVDALDPGEQREITTTVSRGLLNAITQNGSSDNTLDAGMLNLMKAIVESHWVGNLNVYFDTASDYAVERHCAFDLKVPAGMDTIATFSVRGEDCTFGTRCSDGAWSAEILSMVSLGVAHLRVRAPDEAGKRASITVDVTRTSDGKVVPVEFEFETVADRGETVGCVKV